MQATEHKHEGYMNHEEHAGHMNHEGHMDHENIWIISITLIKIMLVKE